MNPEIFREYDIRGIAEEDMTKEEVLLLGKGIGTYLRRHDCAKVTVGRDCRLTSPGYAEQIIQGLMSTGCHVIDLGVCPTPVFYFSIRHFEQEGGVMVTASHNPSNYNGFKVCMGLNSVYGEELKKILPIIENKEFIQGKGSCLSDDILTPYREFMKRNIRIAKPLRVGVDAGNGTAGVVAVPILKDAGCTVFDLYCDMDGTFPNHEADPTVEKNMKDLISLVRKEKLDLGVGFDGDGDRIGVVDENGNIVFGDKLMIIFSREILSRKPGAVFISEVKCSQTLFDDIAKHGGKPIMWRTGHSLIKKKMKEENAELAGEMSGHMFFADRYLGFDDATYACLRLLEILADSGKTVSELLADVPKTYSTPEIRVDCPDPIKFKLVEKLTGHFKKQYNVIDIDGVRVLFNDGWGLVRASNTQPALVLRFESLSESRLKEIRATVEGALENIKTEMG
jgi:phosphomannomutase / phosphoglucomutase